MLTKTYGTISNFVEKFLSGCIVTKWFMLFRLIYIQHMISSCIRIHQNYRYGILSVVISVISLHGFVPMRACMQLPQGSMVQPITGSYCMDLIHDLLHFTKGMYVVIYMCVSLYIIQLCEMSSWVHPTIVVFMDMIHFICLYLMEV